MACNQSNIALCIPIELVFLPGVNKRTADVLIGCVSRRCAGRTTPELVPGRRAFTQETCLVSFLSYERRYSATCGT